MMYIFTYIYVFTQISFDKSCSILFLCLICCSYLYAQIYYINIYLVYHKHIIHSVLYMYIFIFTYKYTVNMNIQ